MFLSAYILPEHAPTEVEVACNYALVHRALSLVGRGIRWCSVLMI